MGYMFYVSMLVCGYRGRRAVMSTNTTYLKKINPDELLRRFKNGEGKTLAKELGYNQYKTFLTAVKREYGLSFRDVSGQAGFPKPEEIHLPEIKIKPYKAKLIRHRGDEEIVALHCGDGHAGKITKSFDEDVYSERMNEIFESTMTIVTLHRNMYPIRKLWIPNDGDNVQGENPYQGSNIGSVKMGVRDQIAKLAIPAWAKLICRFRQEFEEVEFDGFPGNHGYDRLAPETSRADLSFYDILRAKIGDKKGITINIHENFGDIVRQWDWRFFITHLDGIPCYSGVPLVGINRALHSWHMQFGGFDFALGGHFHQSHLGDEVSASVPDFMMHSTLVSDDDWALKKLKISSKPSQNVFGIHPKQGITWRYRVRVVKQEG